MRRACGENVVNYQEILLGNEGVLICETNTRNTTVVRLANYFNFFLK